MSSSQKYKELEAEYDHYSEYRASLIEGEQKVSEGLDKAVLTITSAALGLTFTLYKMFGFSPTGNTVTYLQSSWVFLSLSLFFVLSSLLLSGLLYQLNIRQVDSVLHNRIKLMNSVNDESVELSQKIEFKVNGILTAIARFCHYMGAVALFVGVLSFGLYVNSNITTSNEVQCVNQAQCQSGRGLENSGSTTTSCSTKTTNATGLDNGKESNTTAAASSSEASAKLGTNTKTHKLP
ncbi:hypothetical protein L1D34_25000 [Vibrio mediterranei]|uniref:hypothetical protein n=1 Tax=Vibrio mediterranei TaxID=689 RepID=UPI001EFD6D19|nr:hypothetical protein [Vibrio mediterranei]MCG9628087.1 hypothetical protein [Vibrio mediterranei]